MTANNSKLVDSIESKDVQALTMCAIVGMTEVDFDHVGIVEVSEKFLAIVISFKEVGKPSIYRLIVKIVDLGHESVIRTCELFKKREGENDEYDPHDISIEVFNYIIKRGYPWSPTPSNPISENLIKNRF